MQSPTYHKMFYALFVVISVLVILFVTTNQFIIKSTTQHYQQLYLNQLQLQLELSATAIQENIESALSETSILAHYSFVEYEQDKRSNKSIEQLLQIEQRTYGLAVVYAYFQDPEAPRFLQTTKEIKSATVQKAVVQPVRKHWESIRLTAQHNTQDKPYVLPFYADSESQLSSFAYPVVVEESFKGILFISMDIGHFGNRYLQPYSNSEKCSYFITDAVGKLIWCSKQQHLNQIAKDVLPFFPDADQFPSGKEIVHNDEGELLTAWSSVDFADSVIHIFMMEPAKSGIAVPPQIRLMQLGIIVLLLLTGILSLLYIIRFFKAQKLHLQQLEKENELQKQVMEQSQQLEKAAHRYSLLFENANDAILIIKEFEIVQCNDRATKLFNCSKDQLIGKSPIDFSPEFQPENISSLERAKHYASLCVSGFPQVFEWKCMNAEGTPFTAEVGLSAVQVGDEILFQSFIRDITERKKIEQDLYNTLKEREIMLQEIHHRVKNNLQIIDSVLNLQKSYNSKRSGTEIISQVQRRISAMAEAHETMYRQQNLNTINMQEFLTHLVSQIQGSFIGDNKTMHTEIQNIGIPLEKGLLIGFITSELVENAFIHSIPQNETGVEIKVLFGKDPNQAEQMKLEITDNGAGTSKTEITERPGLGMELVEVMTEQINGSITWEIDEQNGGVQAVLRFTPF